jgi:hypothetical protein
MVSNATVVADAWLTMQHRIRLVRYVAVGLCFGPSMSTTNATTNVSRQFIQSIWNIYITNRPRKTLLHTAADERLERRLFELFGGDVRATSLASLSLRAVCGFCECCMFLFRLWFKLCCVVCDAQTIVSNGLSREKMAELGFVPYRFRCNTNTHAPKNEQPNNTLLVCVVCYQTNQMPINRQSQCARIYHNNDDDRNQCLTIIFANAAKKKKTI